MWQKFKAGVAKVLNMNVLPEAGMNDESFLEWLGVSPKTKKSEMSEVTYFTCLKMMSETMAKMPWKYYQKTNKGIIEPEETDTAKLMKTRPNPFMTPTTFWNTVEMNRNHFGNAYVYVRSKFKRAKFGGELKVMDMWIMPSNCVQIVVDDEGFFGGKGKIWYVYNDKYSGQQYVFGTDEVLHFKTSHSLDGITGLPVQYILKSTVEGASESQEFLNNLYKNGLTAKATLEYTGELNEEAKEKLVQAFEHYGAGTKNTGKILPVPLGMKLTPLDIKLSDSQFIELKKYTALQIAAAFGIKPNQINDYEKSSYSNSEMQQLSFYVDTMLFVMKQYEEEVNYKMLSEEEKEEGDYFKLNEKVLLRTDSKTQMDTLAVGINNAIYKPNEARRKLDMSDEDGGDVLIINGAYQPLTNVGAAYLTDEQKNGMEEEQDSDDSKETAGNENEQQEQQQDMAGGKQKQAGNQNEEEEQQTQTENQPDNPEKNQEQQEEDAQQNQTDEPIKKPEEDTSKEESEQEESQEQETAETEETGKDTEGGEEDDEQDDLHKKEQKDKEN